ncbi:MAG: alkaline shock response membrane anchor protein AmaP [Bacillota bacterium]|nr:alkaline shock response membrane anchor protein AmaP [Bacillota bacterium]MDW7683181.1 alkaline shock response membrane anchor protein AmaP [Bacillota bacterium]
MNAREKLYLAVIALFLGAAALCLGAVATAYFPLEFLRTSLEDIYGNFAYVLPAAIVLIAAVLLLVISLRRSECVETLLQAGPLGEVRICFKAVENLVLKAARGIKGVRETKTRIVASDNGLIIFLRAVTYPDQNIPQVTAELQAAVKEYVESTTGSGVAEIKVMIENVVTDTVKTPR